MLNNRSIDRGAVKDIRKNYDTTENTEGRNGYFT